MGLFRPRGNLEIRSPTSDQKEHGNIINPPRMAHIGGLSSTRKAVSKNSMTIRKPGDGKKVL